MRGPLSATLESARAETSARKRTLVAAVCAVMITSSLLLGFRIFVPYFYGRNRPAPQQNAEASMGPSVRAEGPPKAEIFEDDAMPDGDYTTIGGTVRNISNETLAGLAVNLELKRRKDDTIENHALQITPAQLAPQQEGHYSWRLLSGDYKGATLISLTTGADATLLAYTKSKGKKRPPEKTASETVYVNRPGPSKGEAGFSPDNPARLP